ncbi:MAG: PQQ-binding-like beta-propeller repeat protein [Armatimonadota bacterium]
MEFELRDKIDDQYKVIEKHRGGMSVVYVVLDDFSQRRFAVKTLKEELLEDRPSVERFSREARTWMNLGRHKNIVEAIIYREIVDQPFLFLEYVDGTDLQALLDTERRLFIPQLLTFMSQVASGMEYVHSLPIGPGDRGVVHRDLKPGNLMLNRNAEVKVTDFGLAKVYGGFTRLTDTGFGLGTYAYMPPEQFMDAASADRTSDIYSIGVVMYRSVTGQHPVQAENVGALIQNILNQTPVRPTQLVGDVTAALEEVIMRCLAKDRRDRYQSFSEFARALGDVEASVQEAVADSHIRECDSCGYMTLHEYDSCPICVTKMHERVYRPADDRTHDQIQKSQSQGTGTAESEKAGDVRTTEAADELYETACRRIEDGDLKRGIALLRQVIMLNPEHSDARHALDEAALALVKQRSRKTTRAYNWPMFRGNITRSGYTPEIVTPPLQRRWQAKVGQWVMASPAVSNGIVFIGGAIDEPPLSGRLAAFGAKEGHLVWDHKFNHEVLLSPCVLDGKQVFVAVGSRLIVMDVRTGKPQWSVNVGSAITTSPVAWQNVVYIGTDDGHLLAINSRSGQVIWDFSTEMAIYSSPLVWQGRVYAGSADHQLYALHSNSGEIAWSHMTGGEIFASPVFHRGRIYVSSTDHRLYCLDAEEGRQVWEFQTEAPIESSPGACQSYIFIGSRDHHLYAVDAETGAHLWNFEAGDWINSSPAVSGHVVYFGSHDGCVYALETRTGVLLWQYETDGEIQSSPAISARKIYIGSNDGNLYCFRSR